MYVLGIVGSRYYNDYDEFKYVIDKIIEYYGTPSKIVSGGSKGADTLAKIYSDKNNIPVINHYPDWKKYGKAGGPIRNKLIINDIDMLVAFVTKSSIGTLNAVKLAEDKKIKIYKHNIIL